MASTLEILLVSAGAIVGGFWLIWRGFQLRRQRTLLQDFPTEDLESVSMGPSQVSGTVEPTPDGGAITAPFTDDDCVAAEWTVEEWRAEKDEDDVNQGDWYTIEDDAGGTEFMVDDGTGTLEIRPGESTTFDLEHTAETIQVDKNEQPPKPIQQFIDANPDVNLPGEGLLDPSEEGRTGDRKYRQHILKPGQEAVVFGTVQPHDSTAGTDNAANACIKSVPEGQEEREPMFMISDQSRKELVNERKYALALLPIGAAVVAGGVWGLLTAVGVF